MTALLAEAYGDLSTAPTNTIAALRNELASRAVTQEDLKISPDEIVMEPDRGFMVIRGEDYKLSDHAFNQLANKLRIPSPYLKRCDSGLRAHNVNMWLEERETGLLIRTQGNVIRAVLSDKYRTINHLDLLNWLTDEISDDTEVRYELNGQYMDLQVVAGNNLNPRALRSGMYLRNSEVGSATVSIGALVFRTICLNGLVMSGGKWSFNRRHVGKIDLISTVRNAFSTAIEMAKKARDDFNGLRSITAPEPDKVLAKIASSYDFTADEITAMNRAFSVEPEDTMFGVINALTRAGNDTKLTLDSRHTMQKTGGRVTELIATGKWLDN